MLITFLLPNHPDLPDDVTHYEEMSTSALIAYNGNHWRKILTIIAKLVADAEEDWRIVRDKELWYRAKLVYSEELPVLNTSPLIIVGQTFRQQFPIANDAKVLGEGTRHQAYVADDRIWTPYLDYRQFPNSLIEELRQTLHAGT